MAHSVFVAYIFNAVADCMGVFCEAGIVLTVLPWVLISENLFSISFRSDALLWALIAIDTVLVYFIFAASQRFFETRMSDKK